ncbi:MAG: arginase [Aureispira sp.]|nr:arginase [Aureispira sp.]
MSKKIQLIEVISELGAGTRGSSLGIAALKVASLNLGSNYFGRFPITIVPNENELLFQPNLTPHAKYIEGIVKVYKNTAKQVSKNLRKSKRFPIVLAGDHSTAGATIAGLRMAYPKKRLGVIWVDAHADLHTPYTTPSGNMHGMPLASALGMDNTKYQRNDISDKVAKLWDEIKNMGDICPKIRPEDLVLIGTRSAEDQEWALIRDREIKCYAVAKVRKHGAVKIGKKAVKDLAHCDMIYVSFDVDSMDCDLVSKGTGTPVPDGLTEEEANDLVCTLVSQPKVCCLEMVEINPTLDNKVNTMAETAFRVLRNATQAIQNKADK